MEQIIDQGFLESQQDIPEENRGDYFMDVREFKGGGVEVIMKTIRPMHEGATRSVADSESYASACHALGESSSTYTGPKFAKDDEGREDSRDANRRRAVRRSKQHVRWLTRSFEADRLLTLTYRGVMDDRQKLQRDFQAFRRLLKRGWGRGANKAKGVEDWQYLAVPECHENGGYHIHIAIKGWQRISFLRAAWFKALGGTGKEEGEETPGNIDVTSPKKARWGTQFREWKTSRLAAYIVKYLEKTFDENTSEKKRFWHSKEIALPKKERFILGATDFVSAIKEAMGVLFFNYGFDIDFSRSWVTTSGDCLWLSLGER